MKNRNRVPLRLFAVFAVAFVALLLWTWFAPIKSGAMPDQLDLGTLAAGVWRELTGAERATLFTSGSGLAREGRDAG